MHGYLSEGRKWTERAIAQGKYASQCVRLHVFYAAGMLADWQGDSGVALTHYTEMLALARELGDVEQIASALNGLAVLAATADDWDRAVELFQETLVLARESANERGMAIASNNLGFYEAQRGILPLANTLFEESLVLERRRGDRQGVVYALINLGYMALSTQEWATARDRLREGLMTVAELGLREPVVSEALAGLALLAGALGHPVQAARLLGAADGFLETIGGLFDPVLPEVVTGSITATRQALGEDVWAVHHSAGAALSLEEAVAEALAVTGDSVVWSSEA
jgi:tetratricopeptide (TPR) repeat protein